MCPYIHSSVIYNSQYVETAQVGKKTLWYIYKMEYYMALKKRELLPFATAGIDLEIILLNEISQLEKDNTI